MFNYLVFNSLLAQVFLVALLVKNPPAMQETPVQFLGREVEWLPTPVFWPGEFHGLYSPWGCKELDMTEQLSLSLPWRLS